MKIIDAHTHIFNAENGSVNLYTLHQKLGIGRRNTASLQCTGDLTQKILYANFFSLVSDPGPMDVDTVLKEAAFLRGFISDVAALRKMDEMVKCIIQN